MRGSVRPLSVSSEPLESAVKAYPLDVCARRIRRRAVLVSSALLAVIWAFPTVPAMASDPGRVGTLLALAEQSPATAPAAKDSQSPPATPGANDATAPAADSKPAATESKVAPTDAPGVGLEPAPGPTAAKPGAAEMRVSEPGKSPEPPKDGGRRPVGEKGTEAGSAKPSSEAYEPPEKPVPGQWDGMRGGKPARPFAGRGAVPKKPAEKLTFQFRYAAWKEVLDWFADQAALSLVAPSIPKGTFNFTDDKEYTLSQAMDVINEILMVQGKGYSLLRREKMLYLIDVENLSTVNENLIPVVTEEDLPKRGKFELAKVFFSLQRLTPEEAEVEIKKVVRNGNIVVLPKSRQIQVIDYVVNLRNISGVVRGFESPPPVAMIEIRSDAPRRCSVCSSNSSIFRTTRAGRTMVRSAWCWKATSCT